MYSYACVQNLTNYKESEWQIAPGAGTNLGDSVHVLDTFERLQQALLSGNIEKPYTRYLTS